MAVPKTTQTRYMDGSGAGNTDDYTSNLIPTSFLKIERVSKLCCQSTRNSFWQITKMKNDVGMGLLV